VAAQEPADGGENCDGASGQHDSMLRAQHALAAVL
jgi:hypothetical protein